VLTPPVLPRRRHLLDEGEFELLGAGYTRQRAAIAELSILAANVAPGPRPRARGPHCARLVAAALLLSGAVAGADAASDDETRKIQALLADVERMDATFVRNGKTYDAKTAAEFLRRKWKANDADVATANDFIEKIASKSSTSGKPYLIRFKERPRGAERRVPPRRAREARGATMTAKEVLRFWFPADGVVYRVRRPSASSSSRNASSPALEVTAARWNSSFRWRPESRRRPAHSLSPVAPPIRRLLAPRVGIGLLGVSLAFGLTVLMGTYAFGPISGTLQFRCVGRAPGTCAVRRELGGAATVALLGCTDRARWPGLPRAL
jgi:hypothetical protein